MLVVETIAKIRRAYFVQQKPIKAICRELNLSRKVVRKVVRSEATEFRYQRETQPQPKIGPWRDNLDKLLAGNAGKAPRERPTLVPYAGRFDGFHAVPVSVSKTCLVRFDNNKYSVAASAVGRPVEIRAYADRVELRQDGRIVGAHVRCFGRDQTVYDPWHYVPVLARKPGALRNGAPFKDWILPANLARIRRKLTGVPDGDRQMVEILTAVLSDGLTAVENACAEALSKGVHSAAVVLNILARSRETSPPVTIMTPETLRLQHMPIADCARYDSLKRIA